MSTRAEIRRPGHALPFWLSLGTLPLVVIEARFGGWTLVLLPTYAWWLVSLLDGLLGRNEDQPDTETPEAELFWYRLITLIWFPIQAVAIFGTIWWVTHTDEAGQVISEFLEVSYCPEVLIAEMDTVSDGCNALKAHLFEMGMSQRHG